MSFAVLIRLKMKALPCAPPGVLANRKLFLSITNGLMLLVYIRMQISEEALEAPGDTEKSP